jgi:hypothetical protein
MTGSPTASSRNAPADRVPLHALLMFAVRLRGCCRLPDSNTGVNAARPGALRNERLARRSSQSSLGLGGRGMLGRAADDGVGAGSVAIIRCVHQSMHQHPIL